MNDKQTLIKLEKEVRELKGKLKKQSDQRFWDKVAVESLKSMLASPNTKFTVTPMASFYCNIASEMADLMLKEKQERDVGES